MQYVKIHLTKQFTVYLEVYSEACYELCIKNDF